MPNNILLVPKNLKPTSFCKIVLIKSLKMRIIKILLFEIFRIIIQISVNVK